MYHCLLKNGPLDNREFRSPSTLHGKMVPACTCPVIAQRLRAMMFGGLSILSYCGILRKEFVNISESFTSTLIQAITGDAAMLKSQLSISSEIWNELLFQLHARTEGFHESGAFLLGRIVNDCRLVEQIVYYDSLDSDAYRYGIVTLHSNSFGKLWDLCRKEGLTVVADIHVHGMTARQSWDDRENPMIARKGHLALIAPWFAKPPVLIESLGFYEYQGSHKWRNLSGRHIARCLSIE
jgi:hypothetical protein